MFRIVTTSASHQYTAGRFCKLATGLRTEYRSNLVITHPRSVSR
jgi:hypothetical protein